jgi:hypothetical protein
MATLNPFQYDLYRLAVGILYINLGRAAVEFPTSTKAHPSYKVRVTLVPPLAALFSQHEAMFPFDVRWDLWQRVVVPLFADNSVLVKVLSSTSSSLRVAMNQAMLSEDLAGLLDKIQKGLAEGYVAAGFTPPATGRSGYNEGEDGPLIYQTDTAMAADAAQSAAAAQAQAVWESGIETGVPTSPWVLLMGGTIPVPDPPIPTPTSPTQADTVKVVPAPENPGGLLNRPGTVALEYEKFD